MGVINTDKPTGAASTPHLRQPVPRVNSMNFPDVVLTGEDGEQTGVGVVELEDKQEQNS